MSDHYQPRCRAGRWEFTSPLGVHFAGFDYILSFRVRYRVQQAHINAVRAGTAHPALMSHFKGEARQNRS